MILEIKIPSPGESINEVLIAGWLKEDGDAVELDENILEIESEKATLVMAAESSGELKILIQEGETVEVGAVVGTIDTEKAGKSSAPAAESPAPSAEKKQEPVQVADQESSYATGTPAPSAKKISDEKGIDLKGIKGTGKDGRITKQDVAAVPQPVKPEPVQPSVQKKVQVVAGERTVEKQKLTPLRKKIAARLVSVKNETAMLTTFNEVDMSPIMSARKTFQEKFVEKHQIKLGFMSFFTAAVTQSLKLFPALNAYYIGDSIEYHNYMDIGISVSAPKGLVVPVIRNAEHLNLAELEKEILRLAGKARNLTLSIDEMTSGTFTITNGGVFGSLLSTPILNPPQSAILGMHNIVERPIAVDGQVVIRPMMYVALSYDHRIVDGRESVSFLVNVKKLLENPVGLFLDL